WLHELRALLQTPHTELPEDVFMREPARAAPSHLVPLNEEVLDTVIDMMIDGSVCLPTRAIAEVGRPTRQKPVQSVAYVGPCPFVAGHEEIADLRLDPLHTLLGWAYAWIPSAVLPVPQRTERIAKEVEAFRSGVAQRGLCLVQREPEL